MKLVKGNLFDHLNEYVLIPHVVNNVGVFGAGFARAVGKYLPAAQRAYFDSFRDYELGDVQFVCCQRALVANMFGQNNVIGDKNPRPLNYGALALAMESVAGKALQAELKVFAPKFGSHLAGGNWEFIELLIEDIWTSRGIDVTVFEL